MGGEKSQYAATSGGILGSPPRGRGKAAMYSSSWKRWRITPAWAGKRWYTRYAMKVPPDHPRVGGEKTKKIP